MEEACATTVAAALDPSLEGKIFLAIKTLFRCLYVYTAFSGSYLDDCKPIPATLAASSPENAAKLWELSEKLVGQKFAY